MIFVAMTNQNTLPHEQSRPKINKCRKGCLLSYYNLMYVATVAAALAKRPLRFTEWRRGAGEIL